MKHRKYPHRLNLRLDTELYEALKKKAEEDGISIASLCRSLLKLHT